VIELGVEREETERRESGEEEKRAKKENLMFRDDCSRCAAGQLKRQPAKRKGWPQDAHLGRDPLEALSDKSAHPTKKKSKEIPEPPERDGINRRKGRAEEGAVSRSE